MQRRLIALGAVAELAMTAVAVTDMLRRGSAGVRGRRPAWLASFVVQPFGPLAYLAFGRRR